MATNTNPRKRSRSPERFPALPSIGRHLGPLDRPPFAPPHGPTSAPRYSETSSPNGPNPSHFSSRTPPQLHTGYQPPPPPPPVRQTQQSLPSLSEVMGAPSGPLKPLVPGGLVVSGGHHNPYSAPSSQNNSPHPSHQDQRTRGYELQGYGGSDMYGRQPSQYSSPYSSEPPRPEHSRYQSNASPISPSHAPSPYGYAPPSYPHDHYRNPDQHFMKKENGMSTSIPPYGPTAERALAYSTMKREANFIKNEVVKALTNVTRLVELLEHNEEHFSEYEDALAHYRNLRPSMEDSWARLEEESRNFRIRSHHVNSIQDQGARPHSQPPRGSPYQSYVKSVEDPYEDQKRFAQPDQKRARRGRAAPPGRCHSCNRSETPEWRRGPDGARTLCNACGLHFAKISRKNQKNGVTATS